MVSPTLNLGHHLPIFCPGTLPTHLHLLARKGSNCLYASCHWLCICCSSPGICVLFRNITLHYVQGKSSSRTRSHHLSVGTGRYPGPYSSEHLQMHSEWAREPAGQPPSALLPMNSKAAGAHLLPLHTAISKTFVRCALLDAR